MSTQTMDHDPLVLVHGLKNQYRWSNSFIRTLAQHWKGSIFIIFTSSSSPVQTQLYKGKTVVSIGQNNYRAGTKSIKVQTARVAKKIRMLQQYCGLSRKFHLIGHSMGGLISRKYAYDYPGTIKNIVTLGTPHQGTPLTNRFSWLGWIAGGLPAFHDLTTESLTLFNRMYPPPLTPLHTGGEILTIRGITKGLLCKKWGSMGEELIGWYSMRLRDNIKESDGLVPASAAVVPGARHIADFPGDDHMALVRKPQVAREVVWHLKAQPK